MENCIEFKNSTSYPRIIMHKLMLCIKVIMGKSKVLLNVYMYSYSFELQATCLLNHSCTHSVLPPLSICDGCDVHFL